jgi:hypothetical protein
LVRVGRGGECRTFVAVAHIDDAQWAQGKYLAIAEVLTRLRGGGKRSSVSLGGTKVRVRAAALPVAMVRLSTEGETPQQLRWKTWRRNGSKARLDVVTDESGVRATVRVESVSEIEAFGLVSAVHDRLARSSNELETRTLRASRSGRVLRVIRRANGSAWFVAISAAVVAGLLLSALHLLV